MKKIKVTEETTLLALLLQSGYSRTKGKQLLKYRAVAVNDQPAKRLDQVLAPGDLLIITSEKEVSSGYPPCPGQNIIYEDADILVIDKPPGLLTIASETEKTKTAYHQLTACLGERSDGQARVFIVHRLDQGTSGLLVFAKNEIAKHTLQGSWQDAQKKYRALAEGRPQKDSGTISSYLCESKIHRVYSIKTDNGEGKYAETQYQVVQSGDEYTLLDITLITGRKNQIRVHLADLGHPVAGDKKYGAKTDPIKRLALQAYFLAFNHPVSGKPMEFTLDPPAKFSSLLAKKKVPNPDRERFSPLPPSSPKSSIAPAQTRCRCSLTPSASFHGREIQPIFSPQTLPMFTGGACRESGFFIFNDGHADGVRQFKP